MPFQSNAQRNFMFAKHPAIAKKWAAGQHSTSGPNHKMPFQAAAQRKMQKGKAAPKEGSKAEEALDALEQKKGIPAKK